MSNKNLLPGPIVILPSKQAADLFSSRYIWPATKFAAVNGVTEQIAHLLSEIDEAAVEVELLTDADFTDVQSVRNLLPFFRELGDVQASIETLWRILDRIYGAGFSERMILRWIEEKNAARGYYPEAEPPAAVDGLLLCPCCGSPAAFGQVCGGEYHGGHFVECTNALCRLTTCLLYATGDDPKPMLAERWNRRTVQTAESEVCNEN